MLETPRPLKDRYNFNCCGQSLAPSLMMQMGINSGHGSCTQCKTFLHLEIKPDNTEAVSTLHSEYVEKMAKV